MILELYGSIVSRVCLFTIFCIYTRDLSKLGNSQKLPVMPIDISFITIKATLL